MGAFHGLLLVTQHFHCLSVVSERHLSALSGCGCHMNGPRGLWAQGSVLGSPLGLNRPGPNCICCWLSKLLLGYSRETAPRGPSGCPPQPESEGPLPAWPRENCLPSLRLRTVSS